MGYDKLKKKNRVKLQINLKGFHTVMDKYEYTVRLDEIHKFIDEGDYQQAAELADTIDWGRVKGVMTLCTISDLYKINRRFNDSRDILLMAYDRNPNARLIVYSLCELSIKLDDFVGALQYYNKFSNLAPNDSRIYMLKYKLYEAQNVPLEERIEVLEELKNKELKDKWLYELAYLYHRVGLETKCVEECDEIFTLFREGRFVSKALDLKKLHAPLSDEQQIAYDSSQGNAAGDGKTGSIGESDISASSDTADLMASPTARLGAPTEGEDYENAQTDDDEIHVKPLDMNNPYNTINLQQALAADMKEVLGDEEPSEKILDDMIYGAQQPESDNAAAGNTESDAYGETDDDSDDGSDMDYDVSDHDDEQETGDDAYRTRIYEPVGNRTEDLAGAVSFEEAHKVIKQMADETAAMKAITDEQANSVPGARTGVLTPLNTSSSGFDDVLNQESDGQISLVMPDAEAIEKQITGQLSIDDIMSEWEQMKQDNEKKRMNEVRQRILQNTGNLFDDFDDDTKNGLLEQLEKAFVAAIMKESKEKGEAPDTAILSDEEITRETTKAVKQATEPLPVITDEDLRAAKEDDEGVEEIEEIDESQTEESDEQEDESDDEHEADDEGKESEEDEIDEAEPDKEHAADDIAGNAEENKEEPEDEDESDVDADETADDGSESDGDNTEESVAEEAAAIEDTGREKDESNGSDASGNNGSHILSEEERQTYARFISHRRQREQLLDILDKMSMASYTGNVIITGEEEPVSLSLTMKLIRSLQNGDSNFIGKVAKIKGNALNDKEASGILDKIEGGALVITHASGMSPDSMKKMLGALESDSRGVIVFLLDSKDRIDKMTGKIPKITETFCSRVDLEGLNDDSLVEYAKQYADQNDCVIDELGILALHTRIENMQSNDHAVTVSEVRELIDNAIGYAEKKSPKHLMDTLFHKRFDEEDRVILHEKDFMHDIG